MKVRTRSKNANAIMSICAALLVSGCVSQQSALDFNGQQVTQPVPTGVSLSGSELNTPTDTTATTTANNIPVKAPRPSTNTQAATAPVVPGQTVAASAAPTLAQPLAISETPGAQTPTGNVIAQAAPSQAITDVAVPTANPVPTSSTQPSVEVASLAPNESAPRQQTSVYNPNKPKVQKNTRASSRINTASLLAERPGRSLTKPKVKRPKTVVASVRPSRNQERTALPGVKSNSEIFGIKDEDTKISNKPNTTQVAAVGSLGRLSPNGIRVQHSKVQVGCLKQGVLRILKMVERRYGKKPIVTSGYRSPKGNKRAGGARNSQHIFCKAVDIQVEGVSKWQLAKYLRTVPGRGGVGTYCRTKSVHIDIGSVRDWHHPCRKSSKRKRKKA